MLLKVISDAAIDEPGELCNFEAGWTAPAVYVLVDDLLAHFIDLDGNHPVLTVLRVILVAPDADAE